MDKLTLGIRNNNYLNIKNNPRKPWQGLESVDPHGHTVFRSPEWGLRAAIINLRTYWFAYGLRTVRDIIGRWAPADDTLGSVAGNPHNSPSEYTDFVCQQGDFRPGQNLELFRPNKAFDNVGNLERLVVAMTKFENFREFTFPRREFADALRLVEPGLVATGSSHADGNANGTSTSADLPRPVPTPTPNGADPADTLLEEFSEPLRRRLMQTNAYELIKLLLHDGATAAAKVVAAPLSPGAVDGTALTPSSTNGRLASTVPREEPEVRVALPVGGFLVNAKVLRRLMAVNAFALRGEDELTFFGLRGCLPADRLGERFAGFRTLKLTEPDYREPRCTLGQWRLADDTLAVFPGSTVPTAKFVKMSVEHDGEGTNQIMTGYYRFEKGVHRAGQPTGHRAFRQVGHRLCRRTADNLVYAPGDRVVTDVDDDNLHAAFCEDLDGSYSSRGCQVVVGFPECERFPADKPPWSVFRDNAYAVVGAQEFRYVLLDAAEVARLSEDPDAARPLQLRCGSHESALPPEHAGLIREVQGALQQARCYAGEVDGDFGAGSAAAVVKFQTATFGALHADGIVGPQTGALLLSQQPWPNL